MNPLAPHNSIPVAAIAATTYYFNRSPVGASLATGAALVATQVSVLLYPKIREIVPAQLPDVVEENLEKAIAVIPIITAIKYAGGLSWKHAAIVTGLGYAALLTAEYFMAQQQSEPPEMQVAIPANFNDPSVIQPTSANGF